MKKTADGKIPKLQATVKDVMCTCQCVLANNFKDTTLYLSFNVNIIIHIQIT